MNRTAKKASTVSLKHVSELIQQELKLCQSLHDILLAEFAALKQRDDAASLDKVIQEKLECTLALEKNENDLFRIITAEGFTQSKQGLQDFLDSIESDSDTFNIKPAWLELRAMVVNCQRQNQVNGRILNISMINTQQALNLLSGREHNPPTYDNQGKTRDKDSSESIAVA